MAWSKISVQPGPVLDEVEWALKKNNRLKFFPVRIEEGTKPPAHLWTDEGVDLTQWNGDPKDPLFERVRVAIENPWTLDNDMALIRDMKAIRGFCEAAEGTGRTTRLEFVAVCCWTALLLRCSLLLRPTSLLSGRDLRPSRLRHLPTLANWRRPAQLIDHESDCCL